MVRRTKVDALSTKSALLDAAEQLFSERGVANTSMMQVAEEANVTRGAIYHHFDNKLDLIGSLMERARLPADEMLDNLAASHANNPLAQFEQRSLQVVQQIVHDRHVQAVLNILFHKCEYTEDVLPIHMRHLYARDACLNQCQKLIEDAISKQLIPATHDPRQTVLGMFGLIDGLMYNWLLDREYFDLEATAKTAVGIYIAGIQAAP